MKTKDKKEIFTKRVPELNVMLKEAKDALFNLKMDHAQKKLKNTNLISEKRKEIARIMTAIKEAEFEKNKSSTFFHGVLNSHEKNTKVLDK